MFYWRIEYTVQDSRTGEEQTRVLYADDAEELEQICAALCRNGHDIVDLCRVYAEG